MNGVAQDREIEPQNPANTFLDRIFKFHAQVICQIP